MTSKTLIDSGATDYISKWWDWFSTFEEFAEPVNIRLGNGNNMMAYGIGNIVIETYVNDNKWIVGTMNDVFFWWSS